MILLWKAEGFWDVCAFTGRNVFHSLALHPHRGRSARAMALLLAQPDVYRAAATALDKQGFPPFFTAISCENMDCANAMIDSSLVTSSLVDSSLVDSSLVDSSLVDSSLVTSGRASSLANLPVCDCIMQEVITGILIS